MRFKEFEFFVLLLILVCSCSKSSKDAFTQQRNNISQSIKRHALFVCLSHSYQLKGNDLSVSSGSYVYAPRVYKETFELTKEIIQKIEADSISRTKKKCGICDRRKDSLILDNMHNEMMIGPKTLMHCIDFYNSALLDSFAILKSIEIEESR